jgi:hypothetical protein
MACYVFWRSIGRPAVTVDQDLSVARQQRQWTTVRIGRTGGVARFSPRWVIKLGISLERLDRGKQRQNGRHERVRETRNMDTA